MNKKPCMSITDVYAESLFVDCKTAPITTVCKPAPCPQANKKGKTMSRYYDEDLDVYVERPQTDAAEQRKYFSGRIYDVEDSKNYELRKQFGLIDDDMPDTPEELVKRIQDGKFVIPEKNKGQKTYGASVHYIEWRDPAVKKDQAGFNAAWKDFNKEVTKARDAVMALPADKALETVQALESWTPAG